MDEARNIRTKGGMVVGTLKDNIFRKRVRKSKHLFRKLDAWGCDYDILHNELPSDGKVRILDQDDDLIYTTDVSLWREKGIILHFKEGTRDHNTQVFLPREHFTTEPLRKGLLAAVPSAE